MRLNGVELKWLGHAGFSIKDLKNNRNIYIDPYNIREGLEPADVILITHSHYDHCSYADLKKIVKEGTRMVITPDCQSKVTKFDVPVKIEIIEEGNELDFTGLKIIAVPAYNIDKDFHPKDEHWIGYIVKIGDFILYHAGDTDVIPEMQKLTGFKQHDKEFVALLPVGGRFTMSAEEAAEAADIIKPTLAIPMHYGSVIGDEKDAQEFKDLCKDNRINVEILEKE